jgi:hypothetical protein
MIFFKRRIFYIKDNNLNSKVLTLCRLLSAVKVKRCEQGSNLRGETPLDFESNALTTRPSQHVRSYSYSKILI